MTSHDLKPDANRLPLIIPVETRVREFDCKLLLACAAAERGIPAILGAQTQIHLKAAKLPRGLYCAKDIRSSKLRIMRILTRLGHRMMAWDEEGLVRNTPEFYWKGRIAPDAMKLVSAFFAWGEDDAGVVRAHPDYSNVNFPVHVTGNPRIDVLRKELWDFTAAESAALREKHGPFILLNTNFGAINHFLKRSRHTEDAEQTQGAFDDTAWSDDAFMAYRHKIYRRFRSMVVELSRRLPKQKFILRPHPSEDMQPWRELLADCPNAEVIIEGSVHPWLRACDLLIHNSCTTAIEAFLLDRPAISYMPMQSGLYDRHLPNGVSHVAENIDALIALVGKFAGQCNGAIHTAAQTRTLDQHIANRSGKLACDRIVDIIEQTGLTVPNGLNGSPMGHLSGWLHAHGRAAHKRLNSLIPGSKNSLAYERHRFATISAQEVNSRIGDLTRHLGRFQNVAATPIERDIFMVRAV